MTSTGLHPAYPIGTERLLLRPVTAADVDDLHAYKQLPDAVRYVPYPPQTRAQVAERIGSGGYPASMDAAPAHLCLAVERRDEPGVIGDVVLMWHSAEQRSGEIGYIFHPRVAGQGYATEAARALLRLGFDDLGLHRIVARLDARNTASARVAERLGMRREAHFLRDDWFKDEWTDTFVYALLEDEWRAASTG
ncbi:MAG: GNAT family N-acetyltransferase [Jatrophihabitans sp.]|uniref:GNAT family N-acetyltransferase n=1 Tax=Jatrophihabitans sp. TaxID=1932789 RepID=UPI003F80183B